MEYMKKCYIAGGDSMEQNLSQYKIFYEVAKAGNISKAAKELYISQPAISKAISKLEESLSTLFKKGFALLGQLIMPGGFCRRA